MGIQGLLPFLSNSTTATHISKFENEFVAVDAYSWLHKGIYSCAFELAMHKPTTMYVTYCMKYIDMLCYYNVKPILVFDGRLLSSKLKTEKKRREERERKYERGKELFRAGDTEKGKKLLGESVEVTHDMAVNLMKECRKMNIDCIVAPYEADAQLAFLSLSNVVKCVITEDSDLLAYGCERVMFKMNHQGHGQLIEKKDLHFSLGMTPEELNVDIFRYICILSGCDYLPSLNSIGPKRASKFVKLIRNKNIYDELPRLPFYLEKKKLVVPPEYVEGFKIAEKTFQHQLVYDPFRRMQVPLKPVTNDDDIVGEKLPEDEAFQLAIGNIDPMTMKKVYDYDPDEVGAGDTKLWRIDLLPNPAPRRSICRSSDTLVKTNKRQRENLMLDYAHVPLNNCKKQCIPPPTTNVVNPKDGQKIPANGFVFEPKVLGEKEGDFKKADETTLFISRYFAMGHSKKSKTEQLPLNNEINFKRKENSEEYLTRLFEECLAEEEGKLQELCGCGGGSSQSENICISCGKCSHCCTCCFTQSQSESQELDKKVVELPKHKELFQHSLLDEIYKKEKEESNEQKTKPEPAAPCSSHSSQNVSVLSKFDISGVVDLDESENNDKEIIFNGVKRSHSPVFNLQKPKSSLKPKSIIDTASTSTSVYFSGTKLTNKTSQVSKGTSSTFPRKLGGRASGSVTSNSCRNFVKSLLAPRTLFHYGFKKGDKVENGQ